MGDARHKLEELRAQNDALLTVLNAILLAYGMGPDGRLRVVDSYVGQRRRPVAIEPVTDGFIAYLEPLPPVKEDADVVTQADSGRPGPNRRSRRAAERAARRGQA